MNNFNEFWQQNKQELLEQLKEFLSIASISTDSEYKSEINKAIKWLENKFGSLGFKTKALLPQKPSRGLSANPVVYAEYIVDSKLPTVMVYGHYDVQPPGDLSLWKNNPFEPVIKDGKIYARGANDNKGQLFANIVAAEYYIKNIPDSQKKYNIKFFVEGEEEVSGVTTDEVIQDPQFKDILQNEYLWISDGPWISHDKPSLVYSLRGIVYFDLVLENMPNEIHSGIYGNVVLNVANLAGYIVAKLKDIKKNRIRIPGIYKDVRDPSKKELELINKASPSFSQIKEETGAKALTKYRRKGEDFPPLALTGLMPSLDVHGLYSGYTKEGGLKTIIPPKAMVKFSIRLVKNMDVDKTVNLVRKYLEHIIPKGVKWSLNYLASAEPFLTDPSKPEIQQLLEIMSNAFSKQAVLVAEGGSIGLVNTFAKEYNPTILMPNYGLPDDGLHSPNEKFNISQIEGGAKTLLGFLAK